MILLDPCQESERTMPIFYHTFPGIVNGLDDTPTHFNKLRPLLPKIKGATVLDVGAWDGWYSFKMAELGASRVLATDHFCWGGHNGAHGWASQEGFDILLPMLGRGIVKGLKIDPSEISPETVGVFDIVLYLGILYHRPDCLQSFMNSASVCRGHLVVESLIDLTLPQDRPLLAFHPFDSCGGDNTNWFVPNIAAIESMFELAGFSQLKSVVTPNCPIEGHGRVAICGRKLDGYI